MSLVKLAATDKDENKGQISLKQKALIAAPALVGLAALGGGAYRAYSKSKADAKSIKAGKKMLEAAKGEGGGWLEDLIRAGLQREGQRLVSEGRKNIAKNIGINVIPGLGLAAAGLGGSYYLSRRMNDKRDTERKRRLP